MLEAVKIALRIKNTAYDSEITGLIEACKLDLKISGVKTISESDALIERAIEMYCKANFGIGNTEGERWQKAYDSLKEHLALAGDYNV